MRKDKYLHPNICPNCGGDQVVIHTEQAQGKEYQIWVYCDTCEFASTPVRQKKWAAGRQKAIRCWNKIKRKEE